VLVCCAGVLVCCWLQQVPCCCASSIYCGLLLSMSACSAPPSLTRGVGQQDQGQALGLLAHAQQSAHSFTQVQVTDVIVLMLSSVGCLCCQQGTLMYYTTEHTTASTSSAKVCAAASPRLARLVSTWFQVAPHLVLWQAVTLLAQGLRGSREAVLWCKERAARAGDRVAALVPALQELERAVLAPGQGVEVRLVESVSITLVMLAKVGLHQC
jgi:hypothetical protein